MAPIIHRIEASYSTEDSEDHLIHITNTLPYRLLGHSYKPFARREVDGSFFLVPSYVSCYISWRDHLPMIFELHSQREEANHIIAECAAESWNMLLSEARARSRRDPTFRWHLEFIRPLVLLKTRYPVLSVDFFCLTLGGLACIWVARICSKIMLVATRCGRAGTGLVLGLINMGTESMILPNSSRYSRLFLTNLDVSYIRSQGSSKNFHTNLEPCHVLNITEYGSFYTRQHIKS